MHTQGADKVCLRITVLGMVLGFDFTSFFHLGPTFCSIVFCLIIMHVDRVQFIP